MTVAQNKGASGPAGRSAPTPHTQTSGASRVRRRWPRRVLLLVGALVLIVVGICAYLFAAYQLRTHPGAKSVGSALHSFRDSGPTTRVPGSSYAFPQAGVYTMRGTGLERISFPPNSQQDGLQLGPLGGLRLLPLGLGVAPAEQPRLPGLGLRGHVDHQPVHRQLPGKHRCPAP